MKTLKEPTEGEQIFGVIVVVLAWIVFIILLIAGSVN